MIPRYGIDFKDGDILFTKKHGDVLSDAISTVLDVLDDAGFDPSHVLIIQDDKWGIESAEHGVRWCRLHPYWHEGYDYVIARPKYTDEDTPFWIIREALKYYGRPYDYTGLVMGFPIMLLTKLSRVIKPFRKVPVPLHLPTSFVCSAFVAQVLKDTHRFDDVNLLNEWHCSRITPAMLLRDFPWEYTYEYHTLPTTIQSGTGDGLTKDSTRPDNPYHSESNESHDVNDAVPSDVKRRQRIGTATTAPDADDGWKCNLICAECTANTGSVKGTEG